MGRSKSKSKTAAPAGEPTPPKPQVASASASGSDSESDYSSDDTIEDEDGDELTPAMDAAILRTLARIRNKDGVYTSDNIMGDALIAAQEQAAKRGLDGKTARKTEEKPFLLKDMHRANLLAGVQDESDEEEGEEPLTNVEAERRARKEAVSAFHALADSDDEDGYDEEDGFLTKRTKDAEEVAGDDAAYRAFLLEMGGGEDEVRRTLGMGDAPATGFREDVESDAEAEEAKEEKGEKASKKDRKKKAEDKAARDEARRVKRAQADEDFLMDYILNRGWIDRQEEGVPTYEDIVGRAASENGDSGSDDEADGKGAASSHPWGKLDEEDEFDEAADAFEHTYNFRFEEPDAGSIVTHPRVIESLVRREDDTRKTKRETRAERKAAEKAVKEEETRRLKGAKRREMEGMLGSLKAELGDYVDWDQIEKIMDGDFDEGEWDRVVTAMLEAKAAREDEGDDPEEDDGDIKPEWEDDDMGDYPDETAEWVEPEPWNDDEPAEDDEDAPFNMDADYIELEDEAASKKNKKMDKKARKAEKRAAEAAAANAELSFTERTEKLKEAATELNNLQGEGMIGDLRTRFKYVKSAPVSFGLTPYEILMATDAELNEIASVKFLAPYRRGGLGTAGRGLGQRVRSLKAKIADRKWGDEMPEENDKKKRRRTGANKDAAGGANAIPLGDGAPKKRLGKKERHRAHAEGGDEADASAAAPAAAPAGGKRKREDEEAAAPPPAAATEGSGEGKKKRRKKKKAAAD